MVPDHETVKQIFAEVYNKFYLKWRKELTQDNVDQMLQEAHELDQKYNHQDIVNINALIECIEEEWRRKHPC